MACRQASGYGVLKSQAFFDVPASPLPAEGPPVGFGTRSALDDPPPGARRVHQIESGGPRKGRKKAGSNKAVPSHHPKAKGAIPPGSNPKERVWTLPDLPAGSQFAAKGKRAASQRATADDDDNHDAPKGPWEL
jgi:hypothetical protein